MSGWRDLREMLKHPLFLTLTAFALTTGLGTFLSMSIQDATDARARLSADHEAADRTWRDQSDAVNGITVAIFERAAITDLLRSAIRRGVEHEVMERKRIYDEVYLRWNGQMPDTLATLRDLDGRSGGELFTLFDTTILNVFSGIDGCATEHFDRYLDTLDPEADKQGPIKCKVNSSPDEAACPLVSGADQLDWLRRCVIVLRAQAIGLEQTALGRFATRRAEAIAQAECLFRERPGIWRKLWQDDATDRAEERALAQRCAGAAA